MSEFGIRPETMTQAPRMVAPVELFGVARMNRASEDPATYPSIFMVLDRAEHLTSWSTHLPFNEANVQHDPVLVFGAKEGEPQFSLTTCKYDTKEAYENTSLRGVNSQTLLAAIANYTGKAFDSSNGVLETFCIDRFYNAYIQRDEIREGEHVFSWMPAGLRDIAIVMGTLHYEGASLPRGLVAQAVEIETPEHSPAPLPEDRPYDPPVV